MNDESSLIYFNYNKIKWILSQPASEIIRIMDLKLWRPYKKYFSQSPSGRHFESKKGCINFSIGEKRNKEKRSKQKRSKEKRRGEEYNRRGEKKIKERGEGKERI